MIDLLIEKLRVRIVTGQLTLSQQECEEYWDMLRSVKEGIINEYKDSEEFDKYIQKVKHHAHIDGYNSAIRDVNTVGRMPE